MPIGDTIIQRLEAATEDDIKYLCEQLDVAHSGDRGVDKTELSRAYRSAAGHSAMNLVRKGHDLPYKRILVDVADHVHSGWTWTKLKVSDTRTDEETEDEVERVFVHQKSKQLRGFPLEELAKAAEDIRSRLLANGFHEDVASSTVQWFADKNRSPEVGAPVSTAILFAAADSQVWKSGYAGRNWNSRDSKEVVIVAALATLHKMAGPAYRKTVPVTLRLILIRKRPKLPVASIK